MGLRSEVGKNGDDGLTRTITCSAGAAPSPSFSAPPPPISARSTAPVRDGGRTLDDPASCKDRKMANEDTEQPCYGEGFDMGSNPG